MKAVRSIVLSRDEADYLVSAGFLPFALRQCFQCDAWRQSDDAITLELSSAMAEELRDALTEQLAKVGFDEEYEPTEEGRLLEDLIDRFYFP